MVIVITGATHTGKTLLAQKLARHFKYCRLSQDLLKMGLIRSGNAKGLTPQDDNEIEKILWPITVGIIKTAIENRQDLIVEGCYVPGDFRKYFDGSYLAHLKVYCIVMTENYIKNNYRQIIRHENVAEKRDPSDRPQISHLISENIMYGEKFCGSGAEIINIDIKYSADIRPDVVTESERLIFRKISGKDFAELCRMLKDPEVMYAWESAFSDSQVRQWIKKRRSGYTENGFDYFLVTDKASGDVVGQIGLLNECVEGVQRTGIGYILNRKHRHNGYATEGAREMIRYAFDYLGKKEVIATIRTENLSSLKVAERLGMKREGITVKVWDGKTMPHYIYTVKNPKSKTKTKTKISD